MDEVRLNAVGAAGILLGVYAKESRAPGSPKTATAAMSAIIAIGNDCIVNGRQEAVEAAIRNLKALMDD